MSQIHGWADLAPDPLALAQLEDALGHSVVMAVAPADHADHQVVVFEKVLPLVAGELTSLIGMQNHRRLRLMPPDGH